MSKDCFSTSANARPGESTVLSWGESCEASHLRKKIEQKNENQQFTTCPNCLGVEVEKVFCSWTESKPVLNHLRLGDGHMQQALEPARLETRAELLVDPGVEGDLDHAVIKNLL